MNKKTFLLIILAATLFILLVIKQFNLAEFKTLTP
jgi:hypothetical protein